MKHDKKKELLTKIAKDAFKEASFLRSEITDKERNNLSYDLLSTSSSSQCIYGLISGNCYNDRATQLMRRSKIELHPYLSHDRVKESSESNKMEDILKSGNSRRNFQFFSPIETMITFDDLLNKKLVSYLKKESDDLTEKDFVNAVNKEYK